LNSKLQTDLFKSSLLNNPPSTRYQGSKLKLLPRIWENISDIDFHTSLDIFGGTGSVSYLLKTKDKKVTYNDLLKFNYLIGKSLIENTNTKLSESDINFLVNRDNGFNYENFIERTFRDIYFLDEENIWLDTLCQNIPRLDNEYKRALAYYAVFQSCIIKRPYNLFHRKNLYIRTANVKRGFGNKSTWDKPFKEHFRAFVAEANNAVFDSCIDCKAICYNALEVPGEYDLVYIDPPYINKKGIGVDYLDFYHFLEGMVDYPYWAERIDYHKKHRPLKKSDSPWSDPKRNRMYLEKLFQHYANSILVVSYRNDGIPSEEQLLSLMRGVKNNVQLVHFGQYKYVLSTNGTSKEILLIGV